jgi:pantetheine-phosphate adenylyltransferase
LFSPTVQLDPDQSAAYYRRMARALYAGSFDPVTHGHLDIVQRAAEVFDELIVSTTHNVNKRELFSLDERLELLRQTIAALPPGGRRGQITVEPFSGLLVRFARERGVQVLVRGLRAASDFDYEFEMAMMNRQLAHDIETVFFVTSPQYMFVSSSLIREIAFSGGDIGPFVPDIVKNAIMSKLDISQTNV